MRRGASLMGLVTTLAVAGGVVTGGLLSFEESAIRTQVVRARANLAETARGVEAYAVDWGVYPYDGYNYIGSTTGDDRYEYWYPPIDLTTPLCYVSPRSLIDPFRMSIARAYNWESHFVRYISTDATWGDLYDDIETRSGVSVYYDEVLEEWGRWRLHSVGPDGTYGPTGWEGITSYPAAAHPYDPTNGTISDGDLVHSQLSEVGYLNIPQP